MTRRLAARWTVPGPGLPPQPAAASIPTSTVELGSATFAREDAPDPGACRLSAAEYAALEQVIGNLLAAAVREADYRSYWLPSPPAPAAPDRAG